MKILKRLLVFFVVCAMLLTMIPATVFAEESEQSTVIDSSAVNVEGTNGFGTLLSADIQEEQEEIAASGNADYVIVDLTIDSGIATVEYSALDEAVLVVAIYTEDSTQMLLSGEATVSADATEAQITFNDALPAYFMASAYMLDPETNAPLSTAFDTPMYTQEMQELLASSVEDYDEELVLNLDDTTDTNFAVYHEETVRIESQEGVNTVASVNDEDYIYVIENADESITSLQAGDIFAYPYSDEDLLLVKVAAISIDGTTVTITGEEMELEEAFSHVKIETDSDTSDITVDDSAADEGVTYEGLTEESTPATRAWEGEGGVSVSHGFSFNKTFEKDEAFGEANITFKGSASLNFGVKLSYYVSWTQRSLTFKTTFGASANVEVSGAVAATIPLGYLGVSPVPGVYISFEPEVQLEFSGKLSYTLKIESVIGFSYSKSNGFENISTPPVIESTLEIEGTFFLGFDLNPELSLISPKVVKATLSAQVGAELKAAMTGNNYSWSTKVEDEEHACDDCLAISVGIRVKLEAELKFLNAKRWTFKATILDLLINGEDMYYSFDKEVFGLGKCPYKTYKVTAVVKDSAGQTVEGATVSVDGIEDSWTTDSAGVIVTYLEGGTYTLQAVSSDMKGSKEIEISAAQKIEIPIITCGDFGAELHWSLDHNGLLSVTGSGEIPDYAGADQTPWANYRSQIKQIQFGAGITCIGSNAFADCQNLKSITIDKNITHIDSSAFAQCINLTKVTLENNVIYVATDAFVGCSALSAFQVDAGNQYYKNDDYGVLLNAEGTEIQIIPYALSGTYIVPTGITSIAAYTFSECFNLTRVKLPESITNIASCGFSGGGLTSIVFDGAAPVFAVDACSGVTAEVFYRTHDDSWLSVIDQDYGGELTWTSCVLVVDSGTCGENISWELYHYGEVLISGVGAMTDYDTENPAPWTNYCEEIESVVIDNGITKVGEYTFVGCSNLKSITFGNNLAEIGNSAFSECTSLSVVTIPDGVCAIGSHAFYNCTSLTTLVIPDSVTNIRYYPFSGCSSLTDIYITNLTAWCNIDYVDTLLYSDGIYRTHLHASSPFNANQLDKKLYVNGERITTLEIPNGVAAIPLYAFSYCADLTSITIPDSVTSIGDDAFRNCTGLTSIIIPEGVTSIGGGAFRNCTGLTSIIIPEGVTSVGAAAFMECSNLVSVILPNSLTKIAANTFNSCINLTDFEIPDGVSAIGGYAFENCTSLTEMWIPASVTLLEHMAFKDCSSIHSVVFEGEPPEVGAYADGYGFPFYAVHATAYYPADNTAWTDEIKLRIGKGSLTWVGYTDIDEVPELINGKLSEGETGGGNENIGIEDGIDDIAVLTRSLATKSSANHTASFTGLTAGQEYIFLAVKSTETENLVASDNLLYIDQLPAGEDGTLVVDYVPRENCSIIYTLAICAPYQDIADAKITIPNMSVTGELQMVEPTVVYDGITLIEGTDYTLSGAVSFTEAGNYTLYVNGIGDYIGTASCEYTVYGLDEGVCGDDLTWKITDNSVLTISGTGIMTSYASASDQPWYSYCDFITEVVIESGVTTIGNTAFRSLVNLTSVSIPGTVTSIGNNAFYDCTSLQSIVIPDSVTNLGGNAFRGSGLKTITLGEGVTTIGNSCFYSCAALEKVVIPATVTSIGTTAFGNCSSLTEIRFAGNAPSFGSTAFSGTTVTAYYTVENATWTESVLQNYGGTVTWQAVYSTSGTCGEDLTWKLSDDGVLIISGTGAMTNFASVSAQPWYGHRDTIQTVILYSGVTTIGNTAFRGCTNLSAVTFSGKLTSIGNNAFYDCSSLKKINIPGSVQTLGANAFRGSGLESVRLNEGITTIGNNCFYYCKSLESIKLPASLTSLGTNAFGGCSSLFKVYFKGDAPTIGDTAFSGITATACYPVDNTTWTSSVMQNYGGTITWKATYPTEGTCGENLTWELDAYDTLRIYGTGAMTNYSAVTDLPWYGHSADIKRVVVGSGITTVGNSAFRGCTALTKIELADTVTAIGNNAFYDCTALVAVTVPGHVQTVGNNAFRGCTALRSLTIEEGVTSIGANCFYDDSNLDSVTIPASMTNVGNTCFGRCTSLTEITFLGDAPTFGTSVFYNVAATAYYYFENATWTSDVMANYSGSITWQAIYPTSGTCGENLTWVLEEDGTLTISGIGEMTNYSTAKTLPWYGGIDTIRKIVLEDGVTTVGNSAFRDCINVSEIVFSDTLVSIGNNGFYNCAEVTELTIPGHVLTVGDNAFRGMPKLSSLTIEEGVTSIGANCFYDDSLLTTVTLPASITNVGNTCFGRCTSLREVTFLGDAPTFGYSVFYNTVITAYYPAGNTSWTSDVMANYSGDTTWVAYAELFSFAGATATLGGKLQLDFVFDGTKVTGTDNYAVITKYDASGTVADAVTVQQADWGTYGGTLKQVSYSNIAAKEMGDTITVVIYNADGVQLTNVYEDSYLAYATRALASTTNQEMRTVFVDMLNYGAAAQTQFGYNTVNLVNANLTETQKGWATADVTMTNNQVKGTGYVGSTLTLESEIQLDFMFNRSVIGTDNTKLYAIATYTNHNGNEKSVRIEGSAFGAYGSYTQISVTGMVIADYASLVTCTVYDLDGNVVGSGADSVESYASRASSSTSTVALTAVAIAKFGASAYAYFH